MTCIIDVRGEGPDLVLLHGWGFGSNVWNGIVDGLARNFRVLLVELPGYPRNRGNASKGFDDILESLALELPKDSHLLGWSLGGMFALALARRLPGRFGKRVFVSTNLRFTACDGWSNAIPAETLEKFQDSLRKDVAATLQRFGALTARGSATGLAELRYFRQQLRERGLPDVDALARGLAMLEKIDLRTPESDSDSEMLFIYGDNDALTPACVAADIRSLLPDARTVVFRSAGHAPFLAYQQKFIDIVTGFLA